MFDKKCQGALRAPKIENGHSKMDLGGHFLFENFGNRCISYHFFSKIFQFFFQRFSNFFQRFSTIFSKINLIFAELKKRFKNFLFNL